MAEIANTGQRVKYGLYAERAGSAHGLDDALYRVQTLTVGKHEE